MRADLRPGRSRRTVTIIPKRALEAVDLDRDRNHLESHAGLVVVLRRVGLCGDRLNVLELKPEYARWSVIGAAVRLGRGFRWRS